MPNVWTHLIFGSKVLEALEEHQLIEKPELKRLFNMGCQGPDFLFYHHFLPWKKGKTMNRLASAMHNQHCGKVIMDMLDAVSGRKIQGDSPNPAVIYSLGFVLHHVLDRNMHPYVFSRSGFRKWDHQRFEVMMDTLIAAKLLNIETWKTPVWREINIGGRFPEGIVEAFEQITAYHYPELAPLVHREDWDQACRDMINAQRLFHDPTGIRRVLTFGQIEPLVYKKKLPPLDILNEARRSWIDPTDNKTKHNHSAWMLWDRALKDGVQVIRAVLQWLREEEKMLNGKEEAPVDSQADTRTLDFQNGQAAELRMTAADCIGNYSYETGLSCDGDAAIRYADPIWPDGGLSRPEPEPSSSVSSG
ncbi:zinc dependent phospholipase C family protein [Paenibacillus abyssi]|uniref:Phospholipase C/D domain-containing protein n=1 Tax=Paenibacillus abyssi TaxID=1340531 RepID=A0A917CTF2_9BACL|nr:zinc dependent phospholipase C family protein [Paenibacillus abyssi]GGF99000.1 hypothetical protein GCM10010916_15340 [Paenibacillus abyssi]